MTSELQKFLNASSNFFMRQSVAQRLLPKDPSSRFILLIFWGKLLRLILIVPSVVAINSNVKGSVEALHDFEMPLVVIDHAQILNHTKPFQHPLHNRIVSILALLRNN